MFSDALYLNDRIRKIKLSSNIDLAVWDIAIYLSV